MTKIALPPLNALRVFEAAARLGSFKAAAAELNVTPSAVSHQIGNLEAHLDAALFERHGRRVVATPAGEAYRHRVREALEQLSAATEDVTARREEPALEIVAAPSFASKWLMPRIDEFLRAQPKLRVRVEATGDRHLPAGADVGIMYGAPSSPNLSVKPLIAERVLVLCSPKLLEAGPPLRKPADLEAHVLIESRNRQQWRNWLASHGFGDMVIRREVSFGRSSTAIDAALDGFGVILESDFLTAEELSSGRLVEPLGLRETVSAEDAYFLVTHRDAPTPKSVSAFVAWVEGELRYARE